jgi:integrase
MTSLSIVFRTNKLNKKGEAPVHIRITKDRKSKYISTGIMVRQEDWDDSNKKIKAKAKIHGTGENIARLNAKIWKQYTDIQNEVLKADTPNRALSSRAIRETVLGKKPELFFPFAEQYAERLRLENRIGTYDRVNSVLAKLKAFKSELYFSDITAHFLTNYETHLMKIGNKTNTIHSNLKVIRAIFNDAYRQDIVAFESNPFLKFKLKTEKTQRVYLNEDELQAIENTPVTPGTKMEVHKDIFIFAAYTGGLRISDILQLQWNNIDKTHLNIRIRKTQEPLSIKLPNKALSIIEKYRPENPSPQSFVFGLMPENTLLSDAVTIDKAISSATTYANKNLKIITEKAGIEKNISFHIARHTWATRALKKGVSIDKVSKLMGHAAIKETQIYAKIVNSELDKAMDAFND